MTVDRIPETRDMACDACDERVTAVWEISVRMLYMVLCERHLRLLLALATEALMREREQ